MSIKSIAVVLILSALVLGPLTGIAVANVPGVAVNAPPPPPAPNVPVAGGMGLFKVVVSHRDTMIPATHYIDHVYLFDGNNLIKDWKYTDKDANPNEVYTESVVLPAAKDMNLKAVAHCTLHGYNLNGVYVTVLPAGTMPAQMVQTNANIAGTQVNGMDPQTAANNMNQIVQQDAALLKQIETSSMSDIQQHQMQTTQFFQTAEGKKFLDAFDYTKKMGGATQGMAAQGQPAQGQMMQGQQPMQAQQMQAQQAPVTAQGQQMRRALDMPEMRDLDRASIDLQASTGTMAAGQAGQGQMMQGQQGMASGQMSQAGQQIMQKSKSQGIPQTVWTDSMGNMMDGSKGKQLGSAAANPSQGMMQGQQGMAAGQAGQGQMMQGQAVQGQQGMAAQGNVPAGAMAKKPAATATPMPKR